MFSELLSGADSATLEHLTGSEVVEYFDGDGAKTIIQALFEAKHQTVSLGEGGVSGYTPSLFLRLGDLSSDPREDTDALFIVDGVSYSARDVQRDGRGCALVLLELYEQEDE